jgi:hypothetical protein
VPLVKGFASGLQSVASVLAPLIQHGADAASHLRHFAGASQNTHSRLEGVGKILGIVVLAFSALRAGLAAVNVVQTAYNAVEAITNALMAANPVSLVVIAIAALAAGFVLAYNTVTPRPSPRPSAFDRRPRARREHGRHADAAAKGRRLQRR